MEFTPTALVLLTALVSAGSALIGVAVNSYFNLRTTRLIKESEDRRQNRQLVATAALENWKHTAELAFKTGRQGAIPPLDVFMLHTARTADVVFDPTTTPQNLEERLKPVDDITEVAMKRADRLSREAKEALSKR